uniref:Calpain catalytic domain-containing protein n=2 Tax=Lutzomyia longipalpis TaxID=7200 RepID=A0A1B0C9N4_LUTLO
MTSSYERIKSECKKKNQLWEDPDFPAVQTSVFYHQTPPFTFQWKRPQEILAQPVFINDSTTQFDITPGKMGDRWLVSCLGILYLSKGLFYRVVPADQSFETPYYGVFRFRLWWCGEWVEVLVDDRLPTINGKLAFLQAQNSNSFWPGLLEKAYAKLHGSYEALKYGTLLDGLADLTGGITECIPIRAENVPIRPAIMYSLLDTTSIVTCTTSVFYHQTPPFTFQWKRPQEILAQPVFINDSTTQFDITPGKMGDRWLVSCLGILYLSKGLFYRVVPADQSFETPYYGVFRFRLWWCGEWVEVLVDDRLPTINGKLAFLQAQNSNSFWPGLLEKAYAKLHGSYEALKYGTLLDGLADLTGGITECIPIRAENVPIRPAIMYSLLDTTSIVTCTVNNSTNSTQIRNQLEKLPSGICVGSNYRLCSLDKAETLMGDSVQLVRLRDPMSLGNFGNGDGYNGDWSSLSNSWERVSVQERDRLLGNWILGIFGCPLRISHRSSRIWSVFTLIPILHAMNPPCRINHANG